MCTDRKAAEALSGTGLGLKAPEMLKLQYRSMGRKRNRSLFHMVVVDLDWRMIGVW